MSLLVSFIGSIYVAKKITKEIAKTSIIAAIINLLINLVLIKYIGLYAASLSTVVAYMAMFIYRFIDCKKYVKLTANKKLVLSMIALLALSICVYYCNNKILQLVNAIIVVLYTVFINRTSAKFIFQSIINKIKK